MSLTWKCLQRVRGALTEVQRAHLDVQEHWKQPAHTPRSLGGGTRSHSPVSIAPLFTVTPKQSIYLTFVYVLGGSIRSFKSPGLHQAYPIHMFAELKMKSSLYLLGRSLQRTAGCCLKREPLKGLLWFRVAPIMLQRTVVWSVTSASQWRGWRF